MVRRGNTRQSGSKTRKAHTRRGSAARIKRGVVVGAPKVKRGSVNAPTGW